MFYFFRPPGREPDISYIYENNASSSVRLEPDTRGEKVLKKKTHETININELIIVNASFALIHRYSPLRPSATK